MQTRVKLICNLSAPFKQTMLCNTERKEHITHLKAFDQFGFLIAHCNNFQTISMVVEDCRLLRFDFNDAGEFLFQFITKAEYYAFKKLEDDSLSKFGSILRLLIRCLNPCTPNVFWSSDTQRQLETNLCEWGSKAVNVWNNTRSDSPAYVNASDHVLLHAFILSHLNILEVNDSYNWSQMNYLDAHQAL